MRASRSLYANIGHNYLEEAFFFAFELAILDGRWERPWARRLTIYGTCLWVRRYPMVVSTEDRYDVSGTERGEFSLEA